MIDDERSHRRYNPLLDEWVLCSPGRLDRPWQGRVEPASNAPRSSYDADCYLCPGNTRARCATNPVYEHTFAFDNDFPALAMRDGASRTPHTAHALLRATPASGRCRVICYTPRHDASLASMSTDEVICTVDAWAAEHDALARESGTRYVQLFENRGQLMGASNPHPHAQIWSTDFVPTQPARKARAQQAYLAEHGSDLLGDYLAAELRSHERVVLANAHWVSLVPFWAQWPFQTMLIPRARATTLGELSPKARRALAELLGATVRAYDALFDCEFPYSMGWAAAPVGEAPGADAGSWRLHAEFLPPLLRSATVRKFVVGYELMAEAQRDITPEEAAARLRAAAATQA
jgi:UDPglucose--hexose-1-phosphate uridylyltransferase